MISEEPKNLDAYFHRAIAKNDLGDYRGAIVDYSKIIVEYDGNLNPKYKEYRNQSKEGVNTICAC